MNYLSHAPCYKYKKNVQMHVWYDCLGFYFWLVFLADTMQFSAKWNPISIDFQDYDFV